MRPGTVLVVGAGLAGTRAAETLRAEGYDGRLIVVGDEASAPYERPALSKEYLAGTKSEQQLRLRPPEFWVDSEIELRLARRVVHIDPALRTATLSSGEVLTWDALVLATGARPRSLPFAAPRRRSHAPHPRRRQGAPGLARRGSPPRRRRRRLHRRRGSLDRSLTRPRRDPDRSAPRAVRADPRRGHRSAARGALPLLRRRASPRHRRRRIPPPARTAASAPPGSPTGPRCPATSRSSGSGSSRPASSCPIPSPATRSIPAATSPAGGHWTSAAAQGTAVARRILGLPIEPPKPPFFWSDQFGLRLQLVGATSPTGTVSFDGTPDSYVARYHDGEGRLVGALAANRPAAVAALRRELEQPPDRGALAA